jgi:3-oxoacyl-[acyl-carrier protein] reductase
MTNLARFNNKVVLVTGAAHGIGEAIARRFAAEGAAVAIADMDTAGAQTVSDEINATRGRAIAITVDVSSSEQVSAMVDSTVSQLGNIDVLVNNAGDVTIAKHFLTTDEAWWDHFLDVNLKSQYLACRLVAPMMAKAGGGSIINMSSGGATRSHRGMVAYDASKGGVEAMTRALALELAPYNIRVNALVPGLIVSRPEWLADTAAAERRDRTVPLGRGGRPDDLAGPATFLASDDAAYVSGACLVVDGAVLVQQRSPQVETFPLDNFPKVEDL